MNTTRCLAAIIMVSITTITACEKPNDPVSTTRDATAPGARSDTPRPGPAADNTANNKTELNGDTKTPMDQSQSGTDIRITAEIRRAIMDDEGMSTNAQNCKIVADKSGLVTLRGVVNSQAEKDAIDAKARAVAGVTKVDNQLAVKAN